MKFLDYFFAARVLLHLPVWSVYLLTRHYLVPSPGSVFQWRDLAVMFCLSLLTAAAYYLNQIYDFETDRINDKLGFLQKDILSKANMWAAFVVCSVVALGVAPFLSAWLMILFAQLFLLGVAYSAPPLRLKDRPLAGLIANAYAFGALIPLAATREISFDSSYLPAWSLAAYFTLAVAGVHILTTLPDREGDRATGKKTVAAVMSGKMAKLLALLFIAASAVVAFRVGYALLMYISIFTVIVLTMSLMYKSAALELFAAKMPIFLLTILAGVFFTGYLVFVVVLLIACRLYFRKRFGIIYPQLA